MTYPFLKAQEKLGNETVLSNCHHWLGLEPENKTIFSDSLAKKDDQITCKTLVVDGWQATHKRYAISTTNHQECGCMMRKKELITYRKMLIV